MKTKNILFALTLFFSTSSFCQIQVQSSENPKIVVGKCKNGMYTQAELSYVVNDKDTLYTLT